MNEILKKSLNSRNEQAIQKLAELDSRKEWARNNVVVSIPEYKKEPAVPLSAGIFNMCRQFLP